MEGRIEVTGRQGMRHKQLLYDLKEKAEYWELKEEAQAPTLWRTVCGRDYGTVVRQIIELIKWNI